jgi:ATP-dependent Clp protease ATP-binding subunit ClpA
MANPNGELGEMGDVFLPDGRLRLDLLNGAAAAVMREAQHLAQQTRWDRLRSPHVFMGLLALPDAQVRNWGCRLGADLTALLEQFRELFQQPDADAEAIMLHREFLSDNVIRLLREAYQRAAEQNRSRITSMDLLISILTAPKSFVAGCFEHIGVTAAKLTEMAVMAECHGDEADM